MSQEEFWNKNAENWAQVVQSDLIASRKVTNPALVTEILQQKPNAVIDIGCGEGWLAEPLKNASIEYLGIDGSKRLVEIASAKRSFSFEHVTYEKLVSGWKPNRLFDLAVFNFSLLDEDISLLLKTTKKLLTANGQILIQTLHPANLPIYQNGWNEEDFKTMTVKFDGTMPWYGRTKEAWLSLFESCGLKLQKTVEPLNEGKPASIIFILK